MWPICSSSSFHSYRRTASTFAYSCSSSATTGLSLFLTFAFLGLLWPVHKGFVPQTACWCFLSALFYMIGLLSWAHPCLQQQLLFDNFEENNLVIQPVLTGAFWFISHCSIGSTEVLVYIFRLRFAYPADSSLLYSSPVIDYMYGNQLVIL